MKRKQAVYRKGEIKSNDSKDDPNLENKMEIQIKGMKAQIKKI